MPRRYVLLALLFAAWLADASEAIELPELILPELKSFKTTTPEVGFDVPSKLTCRDVTTAAFRETNPDERLVEVQAPVTLTLYHGEAAKLDDLVISIQGEAAGLRVHDYAPRTELATELAEPISLKTTQSSDKSIGASLGGKLSGDIALIPTVSAGASTATSEVEERRRLAPKQAVVVSGTTGGRTGVYFKLRRSSQSTLEGERTFRVTFVAPAEWAGGEIEVQCLARGEKKWLFVEQRRVWNEVARPVELRLVSHTVAKPMPEASE